MVGITSRILFLAALAALVSIAILPSSNAARAQEMSIASRPTTLRAEATGAGIVLTWDAPNEGSVIGYRVARIWQDDRGLDDLTSVVDTYSTDTTYTDVRVEPSVPYVYYVRAVFSDDTVGSWSRAVNARSLPILPGIPTSGSPVFRYSVVQGELPPGLFLDGRTGELYGTPSQVGHYRVLIQRQRIGGGVRVTVSAEERDVEYGE